jgi:hypothetical protein
MNKKNRITYPELERYLLTAEIKAGFRLLSCSLRNPNTDLNRVA